MVARAVPCEWSRARNERVTGTGAAAKIAKAPVLRVLTPPLLALNERAVGRSRFPSTGIINPGVAADDRSRSMRAVDFSVVRELVMGNSGVGTEGCHMHVAVP